MCLWRVTRPTAACISSATLVRGRPSRTNFNFGLRALGNRLLKRVRSKACVVTTTTLPITGQSCDTACGNNGMVCDGQVQTVGSTAIFATLGIDSCVADSTYVQFMMARRLIMTTMSSVLEWLPVWYVTKRAVTLILHSSSAAGRGQLTTNLPTSRRLTTVLVGKRPRSRVCIVGEDESNLVLSVFG